MNTIQKNQSYSSYIDVIELCRYENDAQPNRYNRRVFECDVGRRWDDMASNTDAFRSDTSDTSFAIESRGNTRAQVFMASIGARVRDSRAQKGMTLQQLSEVTGISQSMLSLVERGKTSASIGTLITIADALRLRMSDLIVAEQPARTGIVIRTSDQPVYETDQGVTWRVVRQDRQRGVEIAVNEYRPGTGSTRAPHQHTGHEYGVVLEGELTVELEGTTHILRQGDTIAYSSSTAHKIWNYGRSSARALWIIFS
jgi:transcriptional regulator with XRE-family HTH domain